RSGRRRGRRRSGRGRSRPGPAGTAPAPSRWRPPTPAPAPPAPTPPSLAASPPRSPSRPLPSGGPSVRQVPILILHALVDGDRQSGLLRVGVLGRDRHELGQVTRVQFRATLRGVFPPDLGRDELVLGRLRLDPDPVGPRFDAADGVLALLVDGGRAADRLAV